MQQTAGLREAAVAPESAGGTGQVSYAKNMPDLRRIADRVGRAMPFGLRQQVTRAGLAFAVSLVVIALAAFLSANNLLFLILAAMLSTLLVSGFISRLSIAGLELDLVLPEHICARRKIRAGMAAKLEALDSVVQHSSCRRAGKRSGGGAVLSGGARRRGARRTGGAVFRQTRGAARTKFSILHALSFRIFRAPRDGHRPP